MSDEKLKFYQNDQVLKLVTKYYYEGWLHKRSKQITGEIKHFKKIKNDIYVNKKLLHISKSKKNSS